MPCCRIGAHLYSCNGINQHSEMMPRHAEDFSPATQPFNWIDKTFIHPPAPEETGEADVPAAAKK